MKKSIEISLKNRSIVSIQAEVKNTIDALLKMDEWLNGKTPLLLKIEHLQLTTFIELSKVDPYVLLFFDEQLYFKHASYNSNYSEGSNAITTLYKYVFFIPYPLTFKLENIDKKARLVIVLSYLSSSSPANNIHRRFRKQLDENDLSFLRNKTFTGKAVLGLLRGNPQTTISIAEFKKVLGIIQQKIFRRHGTGLNIKLSNCEIIYLGLAEPSIELQIIQCPKFPETEKTLKTMFLGIITMMMVELEQNNIVVVFTDQSIILKLSEAIDPNIQF